MANRASTITSFVLGTGASVQVAGASPNRKAISFSPPDTAATVTVGTRSTVGIGQSLTLSQGSSVIVLTEEVFGDIVHQPWYAIASAASTNLAVMETVAK